MSSAASVATISRYLALFTARRSWTKLSTDITLNSFNSASAPRSSPANRRRRSRFGSATEHPAEILASEGQEVEVVVPGALTQVMKQFFVAGQQEPSAERVVTECQRRLVQDLDVHRCVERHRQLGGKAYRVGMPPGVRARR